MYAQILDCNRRVEDMTDNYGREIDYLRISITDRCNLRCRYCMPEEGCTDLIDHGEILSFEEIIRVVRAAAAVGIKKIRLTGGEPLVRRGVADLISKLSHIDGIDEICMTTNGILLAEMADSLKQAGLDRVNISLDTFNAEKFAYITRGGDINRVFEGIGAAHSAGLEPVRINCVAMGGFNDDEFSDFINYTIDNGVSVRFIELMPIGHAENGMNYGFISNDYILERFPELTPMPDNPSSVARYFKLPGAKGTVGFISALSCHFCATCNKVRLTSDGKIKPCLHSDEEIDIKSAVRNGSDEEVLAAFSESVMHKAERHYLNEGAAPIQRDMNKIGG